MVRRLLRQALHRGAQPRHRLLQLRVALPLGGQCLAGAPRRLLHLGRRARAALLQLLPQALDRPLAFGQLRLHLLPSLLPLQLLLLVLLHHAVKHADIHAIRLSRCRRFPISSLPRPQAKVVAVVALLQAQRRPHAHFARPLRFDHRHAPTVVRASNRAVDDPTEDAAHTLAPRPLAARRISPPIETQRQGPVLEPEQRARADLTPCPAGGQALTPASKGSSEHTILQLAQSPLDGGPMCLDAGRRLVPARESRGEHTVQQLAQRPLQHSSPGLGANNCVAPSSKSRR